MVDAVSLAAGEALEPTFAWDGRELLEIGGTRGGARGGNPRSDGAAYDPASSEWAKLASAPRSVGMLGGGVVWTGRELFMFGRQASTGRTLACCVAGLFDPTTDRWSVTSSAPLDQLVQPVAVWTGSAVLLAGISQGNDPRLEAASYHPSTNTWVRVDPPIPASQPPMDTTMVATGRSVVLWSLWGPTRQTGPGAFEGYSGIDVYRLSSAGRWSNVTGRWPQYQTVTAPIFTGKEILLAPGQICACSHPAPFDEHGYVVGPKTLHLTQIPHGPLDDLGPEVVWTGAAEIALNEGGELGGPGDRVFPGDIAIWNPHTRAWKRGQRAPKDVNLDTPPVWIDDRLLALATNGQLLAFGG